MTEEQLNEFKVGDRVVVNRQRCPNPPYGWLYGNVYRAYVEGGEQDVLVRLDEKIHDGTLEGYGWYERDYENIQLVTNNEGIR